MSHATSSSDLPQTSQLQLFAPNSLQSSPSHLPVSLQTSIASSSTASSPSQVPLGMSTAHEIIAELGSSLRPVDVDSHIPLPPVHKSIQVWKRWLSNRIVVHARQSVLDPDDIHVCLTAPDIQTGGMMLWRYLLSALGDGERVILSDLPGESNTKLIGNFPLWALFQEGDSVWSVFVIFPQLFLRCYLHLFICSGAAVGSGARRSVIAALISKAVSDPSLCKIVNAEVYYSLATSKACITKSQHLEMRVFGVACMLFMFTFELAPDPVSPALLQFSITGLSDIMDIDFIRSFAPETAMKLAVWPLNFDTPLNIGQNPSGQNAMANLVYEHLDMQVGFI